MGLLWLKGDYLFTFQLWCIELINVDKLVKLKKTSPPMVRTL